jgi:mRNA interferase MazF
MLCCPLTMQAKGYPFEVPVDGPGQKVGVVLADQIRSLDWRVRRAEPAGRASQEALADVLAKALVLLS